MQVAQSEHLTKERFLEVRALTEEICSSLKAEDVSLQPVDFVSPPKWHLAHTTWFFEQFVLSEFKEDYQLFHKDYAYYFNSYYNNVGTRVLRANRGLMTRPAFEDVLKYRYYVNANLAELISQGVDKEILDIIELGLQHEQQHQELLLYDIKYIFGNQPSLPTLDFQMSLKPQAKQEYIKINEGIYEIGYNGEEFCWDNELEQHRVYLNEFEISNRLVTNAEYIEFIEAGGYQDFNLWHADGWDFIQKNKISSPMYWHKVKNQWMRYTLNHGLVAVETDLPVCHISLYEAFAYSQWKNLRLPTEFEWEVASSNFNNGQLWEWTNSAYLPYPNFKKVDGALGEYNGKFMINQMVLRGGSIASSPNHIRPTYRNFFQPEMRWLFSGIRLAK